MPKSVKKKKVTPIIRGVAKKLDRLERSQLEGVLAQQQAATNEWIRRQVLENNRIDILAKEVLGYDVKPFHLKMLQWQFLHPDNLILAFRGSGKTTSCTITRSIFLLCKNRNLRILLGSKSKGNAEGFLRGIKAHFEHNKKLVDIFGPFFDPRDVEKWDNTEISILGRTTAATESTITCTGEDSTITSKHFDVLITDDLITEENSRTSRMRDKVKTWYYKTYLPLLEPPDPNVPHRGEHHREGTRYHFDDLYGHLEANELKGKTLVIRALDDNENSPWPEKFTPKYFKDIRKKSGLIIFNSQYQCHSEDTEFLTNKGWKYFYEIDKDNKLATYNLKNNKLQYQKPIRKINKSYKGNLVHIKSNKVDALVTPNHQMVCKPADYPSKDDWDFVDAYNLPSKVSIRTKRVLFPSCVDWNGKEKKIFKIKQGWRKDRYGIGIWKEYSLEKHRPIDVEMDMFLKFLGFFVTKGSTSKKTRGEISFSQNEGIVLKSMKNILKSMSIDFKEYKNKNTVRLVFSHIWLWGWLRENVKTCSYDARIPRIFFNLSKRQLKILFDTLIDGGGYIIKYKKGDSYQYTSISKQLVNDVMEIGFMIGYDSSISKIKTRKIYKNGKVYVQRSDSFRVCLRKAIGNGIDPNKQIYEVPYSGNVVCFKTKNATLITRRNGKILISGNCDTEAMKGEIFQYDDCQQIDIDDYPATNTLKIYMGVDLNVTEREINDKFAIAVIGIQGSIKKDDYYCYLLDYYLDFLRPTKHAEKIFEFYDRWSPIKVGIESNQYQDALRQTLKEKRPNARIYKRQVHKDKMSRAWKLSAIFENKRFYFKKGVHSKPIENLILFPSEKHRDFFDALDHAVGSAKQRTRNRTRRSFGVL